MLYFVAYEYQGPTASGLGNGELYFNRPVCDHEDVRELEKLALEEGDFEEGTALIITNWRRFEDQL